MKVFITASFKEGKNKKETEQLCSIVRNSGFEDYCFARDEGYFDDSKKMMNIAEEEIKKCDVLLFDATNKSTGRVIEVGIAYSNKKKIIVIMKEGTQIKDTLRGVADSIITYKKKEDIQKELKNLYEEWA